MIAYVFTIQADANAVAAEMDTRTGPYPKAGRNVGGGIHAPPAQSRTVRYGLVIRHPVDSRWRFPDDDVVQAERGRGLVIPPSGSSQTLDGTWFPPFP